MGAFNPEALLKVLGITEPKRVRLVIAVGYAATEQLRPKRRKELEEIMTYL